MECIFKLFFIFLRWDCICFDHKYSSKNLIHRAVAVAQKGLHKDVSNSITNKERSKKDMLEFKESAIILFISILIFLKKKTIKFHYLSLRIFTLSTKLWITHFCKIGTKKWKNKQSISNFDHSKFLRHPIKIVGIHDI